MNPQVRNRIEAVIGISLLGFSLLLGGYFLTRWNRSQPVSQHVISKITVEPPTPLTLELWNAYERARIAVLQQTPDAQLISATTQWQAAIEREMLIGADDWVFTFYTPAEKQIVIAQVNEGQAQIVQRMQVQAAPPSLTEGRWHEGPNDALLVFMANGGRTFIEAHPEAAINLRLGDYENRGPAWSIHASDFESQDVILVVIDAETMRVLNRAP